MHLVALLFINAGTQKLFVAALAQFAVVAVVKVVGV